ncbi:hypothetical protein AVEN_70913-1 [Araneus ventricosus]|uniref:Uncharacterized protein n=1 Tax=Araneus ventricosus TaxID=182803 RepID=A0A4Y2NMX4_ARAVE|nr:hypothetical protein AVEN_70913-1 [Araneus ventricosus]
MDRRSAHRRNWSKMWRTDPTLMIKLSTKFHPSTFLLSHIRSTQRESIVIVKRFELVILTNFHVLDLPESEKHNFGIMPVCEQDNSKTIRATGMKFELYNLGVKTTYQIPAICLIACQQPYHADSTGSCLIFAVESGSISTLGGDYLGTPRAVGIFLSHVHPTGSVTVMVTGTGTWESVLSHCVFLSYCAH